MLPECVAVILTEEAVVVTPAPSEIITKRGPFATARAKIRCMNWCATAINSSDSTVFRMRTRCVNIAVTWLQHAEQSIVLRGTGPPLAVLGVRRSKGGRGPLVGLRALFEIRAEGLQCNIPPPPPAP